ncbi:MAG: hypothetical protein WBD36_03015 [Bacteroidota bacterium]
MKFSSFLSCAILCCVVFDQAAGQGYGTPLIFQGLNHTAIHSTAARGSAGISYGFTNDVSLLFTDPASLTSIQNIQLSIGGLQQSRYTKQDQHYGGLQGFSAFTPLVESTTDLLADTILTYNNGQLGTLVDQTDSVQRPFDTISPNWSRSKAKAMPVQAMVAIPLSLGDVKIVAGVGAVEYANLNWYYGNNNCFSPSVLSVLNGTISTQGLNTNPYIAQWYQSYQKRDGSIYGYGGAVSLALSDKLSFGLSGMLLKGSTDDLEARVGRGRFVFFANSLRIDRPGVTNYTRTGTSDFSGSEFTLGLRFTGKYLTGGFSLTPPATITRKFNATISTDSVAATHYALSRYDSIVVSSTSTASGEDKIALPWRGTIGFALTIKENLTLGMEYEVRSYASAEYTDVNGTVSTPWLSSSMFHLGGEYRAASWLSLRAGVTNYMEVYEPLSNAIRGDPVSYPVYSLGCGLSLMGARIDLAYEYSDMKFVDTWSNAASITREITNNLVISIAYEIPWTE